MVLAIASAIVTANAYYIHPIIGRVADSFGVSHGLVGAVPALNQVALALGVLLLLPLGDRVNNRRLVTVCLVMQVLALALMAAAQDFGLFLLGSAVLGFFTVTPYLLPAYASKRVAATRLGFVTAVLTTGVVAGVQLSRLGSGAIGEYLGWRYVYLLAAGLMTLSTIAVPLLMDEDPPSEEPRSSYGQLIASLLPLALAHRSVLVSGVIQGLSFAIFLAVWLGIGLHLVGPEFNLGTDTIGYLAGFSAIGLLLTPRLGRWADRLGAERARLRFAIFQFTGVLALLLVNYHWLFLLLPIFFFSISGPLIDVTGRMTTLRESSAVRTRLMSLYITLMFLGGGLGSWSGTLAYDLGGWMGTVVLASLMSMTICLLCAWQAGKAPAGIAPAGS